MADHTTEFIANIFGKLLEDEIKNVKVEEIDEVTEKFKENLTSKDLYGQLLHRMAEDTTRNMKNIMYEEVMLFRAQEQEFLSAQEQQWYKAFVTSEAMYIMVLEATEGYCENVNELSQDILEEYHYTFMAMQHIQGRALQQFLEIITLMKNGFADAAYGRWRSMYELTMISSFITNHGESVAKAFVESSETEDRYEWARASGIFSKSKRHITFNDIQKKCSIDNNRWEYEYNLANKIVHASPQGTFKRLSNGQIIENMIPVGRSNYGITTPAEHSAISLAQITAMFFTLHPLSDSLLAIKHIHNWIDVIRETYFKTHDENFPDEEKLWDDTMVSYETEISSED